MIISRGQLLARLNEASIGLTAKEGLEQSNCFVFSAEGLLTFNDEIMVRHENPLDFETVVNATTLLGILSKIPDEEVEIYLKGGEVIVKGKRCKAGIAWVAEGQLPVSDVPKPGTWSRLKDGVAGLLQQAARTCGTDDAQYLTTCVHVTPGRIEACDNYRMLRVDLDTGFPKEVLLPATSLSALEGIEISKVCVGDNWVHLKTFSGAVISLRCSHDKYMDKIDDILAMEDGQKFVLPSNLAEIVERAQVFATATYDARIGVRLKEDSMTITSRKDEGWYKESKKTKYAGKPLQFDINPKLLVEILGHTRDVVVGSGKMRIKSERVQFVVVLASEQQEKDDDE